MSKSAGFLSLHSGGSGFIMPNAWDGGSARILAAAGFPAIGTTSAGISFSFGIHQNFFYPRSKKSFQLEFAQNDTRSHAQ